MNDKMIICNWYTPAEKMPDEGYYVAVTYSGHANRITYDHALGVGQWMDDGLGWDIEGLPLGRKAGRMKIKVIETTTEIEATASEISASQTIGGRFASLLANALTPYRAYDEDEEGDDAERREE